jgi:hypothetical protein
MIFYTFQLKVHGLLGLMVEEIEPTQIKDLIELFVTIHVSTLINAVFVSTLIDAKSDHYPLLLDFNFSNTTFVSQFKSLHESCKDLITNVWSTIFFGCPMFVLCSKLELLKDHLKVWNKQVSGNVHSF